MGQNRGEDGRFAATIDGQDVERALAEHDEPIATASDLADALKVTSETIRRHLNDLHEGGRVGRKQVGSRAVVWWLLEEDTPTEAPAAPLRQIVGMLNEDEAQRVRERTQAVRDQFSREILGTENPSRDADTDTDTDASRT